MKLLEMHIIQTVAPCNLNRDDTNSPKDALFGGYRRARLSSQSQKRAARKEFSQFLPEDNLGLRTKRLVENLVERLEAKGHDREEGATVAEAALNAAGLGLKSGKTEYLLFMGQAELERLAELIHQNFEALRGLQAKGKKLSAVGGELKKSLKEVFDGGKAVDVALFGRMLADLPEGNIDAAAQVAHAISTHKVDREFDYYTAVDDLSPEEEPGAGMVGDVEFYSATLYRYAVVDLEKLLSNLQGDLALAEKGALAFLRAFAFTLPSGKQNSFAAHNPPLFLAVRTGEGMPRNLATAFEKPIQPTLDKTLAGLSVERLLKEWDKFDGAFGRLDKEWVGFLNLSDGQAPSQLEKGKERNLEGLLKDAKEAIETLLKEGKE